MQRPTHKLKRGRHKEKAILEGSEIYRVEEEKGGNS